MNCYMGLRSLYSKLLMCRARTMWGINTNCSEVVCVCRRKPLLPGNVKGFIWLMVWSLHNLWSFQFGALWSEKSACPCHAALREGDLSTCLIDWKKVLMVALMISLKGMAAWNCWPRWEETPSLPLSLSFCKQLQMWRTSNSVASFGTSSTHCSMGVTKVNGNCFNVHWFLLHTFTWGWVCSTPTRCWSSCTLTTI